jgi:RNase H-like domain found in reverse transcriptase
MGAGKRAWSTSSFLSSRKLSSANSYPVHKGELLTIVYSLKEWRTYLHGSRFFIKTVLIYEIENKPCFSLELSHIQFINYSLHIVDLFHISCHDICIVITSLVTRTNTHLLQYYVSCLVFDYCMCLQTPDSILTSVTTVRHLQVFTLVTTIRGQCIEPPTAY